MNLTTDGYRTTLSGRIPSETSLRISDIPKSYDIPIKTLKENADEVNWDNLRTYHRPRSQ
jgi:hypothetical protein